jgi:hypothetical protein
MSNDKTTSTLELIISSNKHSISSNSYRFCNLKESGEDKQPVEHHNSILSPEAYFVDLIRLIKKKTALPYFILRLSI